MTVQCEQVEQLVQQMLDRELDPTQEAALRDHLNRCETCRVAFEPLIRTIHEIEHATAPGVPSALYEQVIAQLPAQLVEMAPSSPALEQFGTFRWRLGWVAAAAAVLLLVVLWPLELPTRPSAPAPQAERAAAAPLPVALTCYAVSSCATPRVQNGAFLAVAGALLIQEQARQLESERSTLVLCMTSPPASESAPPVLLDVMQLISNPAAVHRSP